MIVQNFAHFQQFSRPGTKGNSFSKTAEVPRCEAACAICQQKDWVEQRCKLALFAPPPEGHTLASVYRPPDSEDEDEPQPAWRKSRAAPSASLIKHGDVYYLQAPEKVNLCADGVESSVNERSV